MLSILFWVLWFLGLIYHGWHGLREGGDRFGLGGWFVAWIMFGILGWKVIGFTP